MWSFMTDLNRQGTTIILTTHYLEEAESLCRNIAIINQGRIVEHDRMDRLLHALHTETFLLDIKEMPAQLPELDGCTMKRLDDNTLEVEVNRDLGINGLFEALTRNGMEVVSMRNNQNRLEQIFIKMMDANRKSG